MTRGRAAGPPALISEEAVRARVSELAAAISAECPGPRGLILVGVLRGSFIFLADLARRLTVPAHIDFLAVSCYGDGTTPAGRARLVSDARTDVSGKDVVVVDDIVETGRSLRFVLDTLASRRPASLRSCVLLRKPCPAGTDVRVDYVGFDVPDVWVVGYGLDHAGRYRALPYIGFVAPGKETIMMDETTKTGGSGMKSSIRKVAYYKVEVPNKAGAGAAILAALKAGGVDLLAFTGFPRGRRAQLDLFPKDERVLRRAAKAAGIALGERKTGFLVQGADRKGAVAAVAAALAEARINVTALDGVAAGGGRYGAILWVKPADVAKAAKVLGAR